jgi:hypothetical protein
MNISSLQRASVHALGQLLSVLRTMEPAAYYTPLPVLSGGTIGKHIRHLIEFYQCLFQGLATGEVNYDARVRNMTLEREKDLAVGTLRVLIRRIQQIGPDQLLTLHTSYHPGELVIIPSTLYRELVYNLEHCIHHQATIRIGLQALQESLRDDTFGVAPSTIHYQQSHVHRDVSAAGQ